MTTSIKQPYSNNTSFICLPLSLASVIIWRAIVQRVY
nr:MAG TPA: hypothetical protein [Caudoviricetes sp.]